MGRRAKPYWLKLLLGVCRLVWRYPKPFLLLLALGAGNYAYEIKLARPALLYQGEPQASRNITSWFRVFRNHGFILGYSDLRGNPLWVEYALTPVSESMPSLKRPSRFSTDWRGINRVSHDSYQNSGYDRGHLAPNYAISHLYGKQGQADSFLMSNISPQKPHLNQKLWQRLEEVEINYFAKTFGKVWVITGPIFTGTTERLNSDWLVEIPDAFYKIYLAELPPTAKPLALAFIVPQTVTGKEPLTQFVTSIDSIEAQTGLDFFVNLEDATESALEAQSDTQAWHLQSVSRLPSRY